MVRQQGALPRRMLVFSPSSGGGIPFHTHYQANELARRGVEVIFLCKPDFPMAAGTAQYRQLRRLPVVHGTGLAAKLLRMVAGIAGYWVLAWHVLLFRPDVVLMEANTEYFAPLWCWPHLLFSRLGTTYIANFHDPARAPRIGPMWWHRITVWLAYRPLSGGLIHGDPPPAAWIPHWCKLEVVPNGLFEHLAEIPPAFDLRERFGIAADAFVLLSFGLVMDRKNIDLLVAALADLPDVVLVLAGPDTSSMQRPARAYREQAEALGLGDRIRVVAQFVPDEEVSAFFQGADAIALTYNRAFVSHSSVLWLAALWGRPVLGSSGPGPLRTVIEEHPIGVFAEPDSTHALADGVRRLQGWLATNRADYSGYRARVSWVANVDGMVRLLGRIGAGSQD